jgi:hypothetical protein
MYVLLLLYFVVPGVLLFQFEFLCVLLIALVILGTDTSFYVSINTYDINCNMVLVGDGRLGYPSEAPYNAIHVGAAAPTLPQAVSSLRMIKNLGHNWERHGSLI